MSDTLTVTANGVTKQEVTPLLRGGDEINITFKRNRHDVEVDMDQLTWGDALKMKKYREGAQNGTISDEEAETLLNELVHKVTGLDPLALPAKVVTRVVEAIFSDDNEQETAAGNS